MTGWKEFSELDKALADEDDIVMNWVPDAGWQYPPYGCAWNDGL